MLATFVVEYLREYESIFETALAHESVDPAVLFDKKQTNTEVENLVRLYAHTRLAYIRIVVIQCPFL
jgi:hypothetical protein